MRMITFAKRCSKEILRDPINLGFGIGFPLVLLFLLSTIQKNIPVSMFEIDTLTPGITVFGLSFMTLFSATLVAKDRESALLQRLYTTPLTGLEFILGYMLPLLPIALGQTVICYLAAIPLGLTVSVNIVYAVVGMIPMAIFNIALGLLCGSILGVKQVGGICGAPQGELPLPGTYGGRFAISSRRFCSRIMFSQFVMYSMRKFRSASTSAPRSRIVNGSVLPLSTVMKSRPA